MQYLDDHLAKVAMDMHKDRERMQMGDRVPTRFSRTRVRRGRLAAVFASFACRLADLGCRLQEGAQSATSARLGAWLSGRMEPQCECG